MKIVKHKKSYRRRRGKRVKPHRQRYYKKIRKKARLFRRKKKEKALLPISHPPPPPEILDLEEAKKEIIKTGYKVTSHKRHPDIGGRKYAPSGELKVVPEVTKKKTEDFKTLGKAKDELLDSLKGPVFDEEKLKEINKRIMRESIKTGIKSAILEEAIREGFKEEDD